LARDVDSCFRASDPKTATRAGKGNFRWRVKAIALLNDWVVRRAEHHGFVSLWHGLRRVAALLRKVLRLIAKQTYSHRENLAKSRKPRPKPHKYMTQKNC